MNYVAQNISTKELYYSKGASKLARFIGISTRTIYRNAKNTFTEKVYNGYIFAECNKIEALSRGLPFKSKDKRFMAGKSDN
jgi:hypothetical protein